MINESVKAISGSLAMSSIPMGAHAAFKVRDHFGNDGGGKQYNNNNSFQQQVSSNGNEMKNNPPPAQYNGKLMNSIWGMYNRYSVHNLKAHNCHIAFDKA